MLEPVIIQDAKNAGKCPFGLWARDAAQQIIRLHPAWLKHAIIPPGAAGVLDPKRHIGHIEAIVKLPAWLARLGDLYDSIAKFENIADSDVVFGQAQGRQIFAKAAFVEVLNR